MKQVLVPVGYGTGLVPIACPQFGYLNNAVASPCTYPEHPLCEAIYECPLWIN
jgi:hypothetical protein